MNYTKNRQKKKAGRNMQHMPGPGRACMLTLIMLACILIVLSMPLFASAMPVIKLENHIDPLEYLDVQTVQFNITTNQSNSNHSNTSITSAEIWFENQHHTLEKQAGSDYYSYSWVPEKKGAYPYSITAKDSLNQSAEENHSFLVIDSTPPELISTRPEGSLNYNLVEIKVVTNENSTCKYDENDVSFDSMTFGLSGEGTSHTKLRSLGDGNYFFYAKCRDENSNIGTGIINFSIDSQPPRITSISPTGVVNQKEITLVLRTDEFADCRWDTISQEYNYLANRFQYTAEQTGGMRHEQQLSLNNGLNTFFLSCKDKHGSYNNPPTALNLELNLPPTASISINKNSSHHALSSRTYEVHLVSSEPLSQSPDLKLRYSNKQINIPLEGGGGSREYWSGYLIIPEGAGEHVAEFRFSGTDKQGTTGTEITSGKLVLVDTRPPPEVSRPGLANRNNSIELSWNYQGEETDHFRIYKSTDRKPVKADFCCKADGSSHSYLDSDVDDGIGYFYKLSAVDNAGNEGPLSDEEFLMTEYQNQSEGFEQEPELLVMINSKISEVDAQLNEVDARIARLETKTQEDVLLVINEKGLVSEMKNLKSQLQLLVGELKSYKQTVITQQELEGKLGVIDTKLENLKQVMVRDVELGNRIEKEQIPDRGVTVEAAEEYLKETGFSAETAQEYISAVVNLQEQARLVQEISSCEIHYDYKPGEIISIVREKILLPENSEIGSSLLLQEIIPQEVVGISDINFSVVPDQINSLGVVWDAGSLESNQVYYLISKEKELNQLQSIRPVVLYEAEKFLELKEQGKGIFNSIGTGSGSGDGDGLPTGSAVKGGTESAGTIAKKLVIPFALVLLVGLLVYYLFFIKSESDYEHQLVENIESKEHKLFDSLRDKRLRSYIQDNFKSSTRPKDSALALVLAGVEKAYESLESNELERARSHYNSALQAYKKSPLPLRERIKAKFELNTIRENIINSNINNSR